MDHRFRLVIADEASQSPSSRALTILARARQAVIIGDTKQALPTDDLSEESKSALDKCIGDLDLANLFLPGNGNSLFEACLSQFAASLRILKDHFRCPPDGMSWSNKEMYTNLMTLYKPSGNKASLSLNVTKNGKEEMAQFVYNLVKETFSSGIVLTLGIIMMGQMKEAKAFKAVLDIKLFPLENQHGSEAVDRHCIKVASPEEFQGQERDIILIGCVPDNSKVPYETDPNCKRAWNVATTRHKRRSVIFSSYDLDKIKRGDIKHKIFYQYKNPLSHVSVSGFKDGKTDVRSMAEDRLVDQLASCGYETSRNRAPIWKNALSIGLKNGSISDNCALLSIENYGETLKEWRKVVHQQEDLEEAGIACLRVDALALSLHFQAVFDDIIAFLKGKAGLSPPTIVNPDEKSDGSAPNAMVSPLSSASIESISVNSDTKPPSSSKQRKRPPGRTSSKTAKRGKNH